MKCTFPKYDYETGSTHGCGVAAIVSTLGPMEAVSSGGLA